MNRLLTFLLVMATLSPSAGFAGWFAWNRPAKTEPVRKIWIFQEPTFVGDFNTRLALAESFPGAEISVLENMQTLPAREFPDLIIHSLATEEEVRTLLDIKKRSKGKTFLVLIDGAPTEAEKIDLIVNPVHMPQLLTGRANVARPLGLPSRINGPRLDAAAAEYESRLGPYPGTIVTLLIGGQAKNTVFTVADAKALGEQVRRAVKSVNGSLFVSNSRRTPDRAFRALLDELTGFPLYVHDAKKDEGNPYVAFLAMADHVIVTGDSSSMISDALTTGRPVYAFAPNSILEERHKRFLLGMIDAGRLRLLGPVLDGHPQNPLDVADDLRDLIEIRRKSCGEILSASRP